MRKYINIIVLSILFFLVGFAIVVLIRYWKQIDFDFKLPVIDVMTLSLTAFLAWWVAGKLEKDHSEERFEKELLIKKIEELDTQLIEFKKWVDTNGTFLARIMDGALTDLRKMAFRIEQELSSCYKKEEPKFENIGSLQQALTVLKQFCTLTTVEDNQDNIILVDGEYCYSVERLYQIDEQIYIIRDMILRHELLINKIAV